ncbi:glycoside hydrolase family protein [Conexibacter woesei]|uniref:Uncharacterized protein n=1 Tax=Conexibacter woesei (strain DSM 14684 / CCUG 47730 / CIP 108061 / JCM 11494 / NBRC 100937 / ID131577) TaxID=469383 RepID=D3FDA7_CONWI|nr:hypothetical protein [Conexibacter woesei]ADB53499.1 hypothetical protein Cwoe_5090 [Conexibacter woesei DSM 14684]
MRRPRLARRRAALGIGGALLALAIGPLTSTALAVPAPVCNQAAAPDPWWGVTAPPLVFGTVIGTGTYATELGMGAGAPDRPAKIERALDRLQGGSKPFIVKASSWFNDAGDRGAIGDFPANPVQYTTATRRLEVVLWFNSKSRDRAGWVRYVRAKVRELAPHAATFVIGEEANVPLGPPWGLMPVEAIVDGVLAAKDELRRMGNNRTKVGFNAAESIAPDGGRSFFDEIRRVGNRDFRRAVDFVGLDAYPGAFGPYVPGFDYRAEMARALRNARYCLIRAAGFPDSMPLHVTENGFGTGGDRSAEAQVEALGQLIKAVHDYRGVYNIRAYEQWGLRDDRSDLGDPFVALGLLRDDYTPKPSFDLYRNLIRTLGARSTDPAVEITTAPPAVTTRRTARFAFRSIPANAAFECRLDGGRWEPCGADRRYAGLAVGRHRFEVRAIGEGIRVVRPADAHAWRVERESEPRR